MENAKGVRQINILTEALALNALGDILVMDLLVPSVQQEFMQKQGMVYVEHAGQINGNQERDSQVAEPFPVRQTVIMRLAPSLMDL